MVEGAKRRGATDLFGGAGAGQSPGSSRAQHRSARRGKISRAAPRQRTDSKRLDHVNCCLISSTVVRFSIVDGSKRLDRTNDRGRTEQDESGRPSH
jgi:hypothetical protein